MAMSPQTCTRTRCEMAMSAEWGEIRVEELLAHSGGSLVAGKGKELLSGLSTDSRRIIPGEVFWALRGQNFDGNEFALKAAERGAAAVVVQESHPVLKEFVHELKRPVSIISVEDTLKALGDFSSWWRKQHNVRLVAITGSAGKTTAKEMSADILEMGGRTLRNKGNFNNLIGLPLTILELDGGYINCVLEMGMNCLGEIARLTEIADPDVGVVLNVGRAHLEGLGDIEGVARAKTELVEQISPRSSVIVNGDDELLLKTASGIRRDLITFGMGERNEIRASDVRDRGRDGVSFSLNFRGNSWPVSMINPGRHNIMNALAAAAAAFVLEEPPLNIIEALGRFEGVGGRFTLIRIEGDILLVDDTYNSNPSSLRASLESLSTLAAEGGRILIGLGDMMELGEDTVPAHLEAGKRAGELGADLLFAVGKNAALIAEGALKSGMAAESIFELSGHEEMADAIETRMRTGDIVFLKGSRKAGLDRVAKALRGASRRKEAF